MSLNGKIAKHDATILMLDKNRESIIECEWDKRRKCDSYYIELYKQQQKKINKAVECMENENLIMMGKEEFIKELEKWEKEEIINRAYEICIENDNFRERIEKALEILGDSNE